MIPAAERAALIAFYNSTDGPTWGDDWLGAEGTECSWYGVTCDAGGTTVIRLEVSWAGLSGSLPGDLQDLTNLQKLDVGGNYSLAGSIPPELGTLTELVDLWLGPTGIDGAIPPELGNLTNLETLYLSSYHTGTIPTELSNLSSLTVLSLPGYQMEGGIPSSLGNLSNLETLFIRGRFTGSIPTELGNLAALVSLTLGDDLTGSIPSELGGLTALETLRLDYNTLSGAIPAELGNLANLEELSVVNNRLSGALPAELANLANLRVLDLSANFDLTGSIPAAYGGLTNLEELLLDKNQLSGAIPAELGNLTKLVDLDLEDNFLTGTIPTELGNLVLLENLDLGYNLLEGGFPPELGALDALVELSLTHNFFSGSLPPEIGGLTNLEGLYLKGNRFRGEVPVEILDLTNLLEDNSSLKHNALYSTNPAVVDFLNQRHFDYEWQSTQTVAPENVAVGDVGDHTVWLSWDAVSYQDDPGGYEVFVAPSGSDSWTSGGWTADKSTTAFPLTGLEPDTPYDFVVTTFTDPHEDNDNTVTSDASSSVMTTTSDLDCAQPVIEIDWGGTEATLSLSTAFASYLWSTGETDPSITVELGSGPWYWVTVTAGGCEETASTSIVPPWQFKDGFETGGTGLWSATVSGL